jgi:hypothetical protein
VVATVPAAWYLHAHTTVPWADGGLEWGTTVAVGLALVCLTLRRSPEATASTVAAPLLLVAVGVAMALPERWAVRPVGDHRVLWLAAVVACAAVVRVASADPARR